ncbi:MAG: phosphoribosyltransferase family protein [Flavobacteriaceae bacterium]|nr:phosphoribosyltransferase family protein [Flavobacteriaceae bacterium]
MKNTILNNEQIQQKIKRIAYQIYESNSTESKLVIAGIAGNGFQLALKIKETLENISPFELILCEVKIDKKNPLNPITTSIPLTSMQHLSVVLVDDVLSTGKTLIYGVAHFLQIPLKQFKTAVLINRNHKKYPVKADFKGLSLSTTSQEHISIEIENQVFTAYLM